MIHVLVLAYKVVKLPSYQGISVNRQNNIFGIET